jgi:hypothetical protein
VKHASAAWYDEPKGDVHAALVAVWNVVRDENAWRVDADEYHAGLYAASDRPGVRGRSRRGYEYGPATLPYNVCRSAVDTLQAKIAKQRPLPQVLTQRGNWKNQKRARKMTQFLEGEFYRQRIFEGQSARIVRDALVFGRGVLKVWAEGDQVRTERVHPWELFTDSWDDRYGDPRNLYHRRSVDKGVAMQLFARSEGGGWRSSARDAIEQAGRFDLSSDLEAGDEATTVERIDLIEAWHRCDRHSDKPHKCTGRHVVVTTSGTLVDEPWEHDYFPFAILGYCEPISGYWAHGLVEQLEGYQYEINLASQKSSEQHRMSGVGILVPTSAKMHDQQFRNGINIMHHSPGGTPQVFQMDLVNEHTRVRPRELTQDALNDAGISQMAAQSQKPSGVTAALALQTLDDIETERFMVFGRAYEAWCLDIARRLIDCAKDIANDYGDLAVSVPMKGGLLDLSWKDVYVDGTELRVFSTSMLPQQLGARLERLKDLWNTGLIDRATFLRQLDAPDMQAELDLETADKLVIDEMLERMADAEEDEGEEAAFMPPSAYQELTWGAKRAQQKLNRGLLDGMPEFNQLLLQRWIKEAQALIDLANPPPAPAAPALAPPPGAAPPPPDLPGLGIPGAPPGMAA